MAGFRVPRRKSAYYELIVFFGCVGAMCFLYALFISHYCAAAPMVSKKASSVGSPTDQAQIVPASLPRYRGDASTDMRVPDANASVFSAQEVASPNGEEDLGSDFYLSQITAFYQNVIGWLLGLIGVILALNYLYIRTTSRTQAEEMAAQALEYGGFLAQLDQKIEAQVGKKWAGSGTANIDAGIEEMGTNIEDMQTSIQEMKERIEFLEKSITAKSYEPLQEPENSGSNKEG